MIIANPIYDVVFKRLMENERAAKFFIGTLLEETVEAIDFKPQEMTHVIKRENEERILLSLLRLDFIATIRTKEGGSKKILIEIQKANNGLDDAERFRRYLAEQYGKEENVTVKERKTVLPIVTIYILGFDLPEIESACIKVERNYVDMIKRTVITKRSRFIEYLTHDSYVVQVNRITDRYQTRLDKILSLFEQNYFVDGNITVKRFKHTPEEEEMKIMTSILHSCGTEPEERREIELEHEAWRTYYAMFGEQLEQKDEEHRKELKKAIAEKDRTIEEKSKAIEEKDRAIEELRKEIERLKNDKTAKNQ